MGGGISHSTDSFSPSNLNSSSPPIAHVSTISNPHTLPLTNSLSHQNQTHTPTTPTNTRTHSTNPSSSGVNIKNVDVSVFILYPEIAQWKDHLYMLKFTDGEIGKLYRVYKKLRVEESNEVSIQKLLDYSSLQDSVFMEKVFSLLKNHETGNISHFFHFVLTLWHYCTIGKDMASLIFDLYDTESQRVLDGLVADQMIKELYGKKFDKSRVALE
jgi:hypothetical protein